MRAFLTLSQKIYIKKYIDRLTSKKGLEKTYAQSEEQRELLKSNAITYSNNYVMDQIDLENLNCLSINLSISPFLL